MEKFVVLDLPECNYRIYGDKALDGLDQDFYDLTLCRFNTETKTFDVHATLCMNLTELKDMQDNLATMITQIEAREKAKKEKVQNGLN